MGGLRKLGEFSHICLYLPSDAARCRECIWELKRSFSQLPISDSHERSFNEELESISIIISFFIYRD